MSYEVTSDLRGADIYLAPEIFFAFVVFDKVQTQFPESNISMETMRCLFQLFL